MDYIVVGELSARNCRGLVVGICVVKIPSFGRCMGVLFWF